MPAKITNKIDPAYQYKYLNDGQPNWELSRQEPDWPAYVRESDEHPFTQFKPRTIDMKGNFTNNFSQGDSESAWLENRKRLGDTWHYYDKKITYKRNSSGFRTYEWNHVKWSKAIVLLGCSCTYGVGVDDNETLAAQLEKISKRKVINLGLPGASNQFITFCLSQVYSRFDAPYAVVVNYSTIDRNIYFNEMDLFHVGPWCQNNKDKIPGNTRYPIRQKDFYLSNFYNPTNATMQTKVLSDVNRALCKGRSKMLNITFFEDAAHAARTDEIWEIDNGARDLLHPGRNNFKEIAEWINERL